VAASKHPAQLAGSQLAGSQLAGSPLVESQLAESQQAESQLAQPTPQPASRTLRLSVLDQSPVPAGCTPAQALANSVSLARHVDALGYHRLWFSEHHAMPLLAGVAPELLIARIGAETQQIRLGSGGVMLPHYSALKVAESFSLLAALYPGRIDLGIGRAPGGGQLESHALRRIRNVPAPDDFPQQMAELLAFLHPEFPDLFPPQHAYAQIHVAPQPPLAPDVWLLGSSMWSSVTAAGEGLPYAYAHFFSGDGTRQAIEHYHRHFEPSRWRTKPEATIAIGAICADTQEEADRLHLSVKLLQRRIRSNDRRPVATPEEAARELAEVSAPGTSLSAFAGTRFTQGSLDAPETEFPRYVVGTPETVRDSLLAIAHELELSELIVNTITHSHDARLRSYTLLAEAFGLQQATTPNG
jgi:luciferase family oxidoreductase group 1